MQAQAPTQSQSRTRVEDDHRVIIDSDGVSAANENITSQLREMFQHIGGQPRKRLVLFIHGGLVTLSQANQNAINRGRDIWNDDRNAYPLFLNWEAGLISSYGRHLAYERNGISYRGTPAAWAAIAVTPFVLISDVGRGAANFAINTVSNFSKVEENNDYLYQNQPRAFVTKKRFLDTLLEFTPDPGAGQAAYSYFHPGWSYKARPGGPPFDLYLGPDITKVNVGEFALGSATIPLQAGTEPILDTIGTSAWKNMLRRTRTMFFPAENFITTNEPSNPTHLTKGAAYYFFHELDEFLKSHPDYYVDVFAHSMGAIVMNEAYRNFPDLRVRNLVYMAAACTIRDFLVGPARHLDSNRTEFYNLCLHPRNEIDEVEGYGIPVRGSLLTWIDEFFESPASFGDRTLGSLQNTVIAYRLLPQTKRIHIKAFGINKSKKEYPPGFSAGPQKHGDFGDFEFWKPNYWSPSVPLNESYKNLD